jgi:hypothetical protein
MKRNTRRAPEKPRRSVSRVKLGCSFFEKWVVRLNVRRISRRRRLLTGGDSRSDPPPRPSRSRRSTTVRVGGGGAARRGPSCFPRPESRRERRLKPPPNRLGEALRVPCSAPLNPVRPAGALGGRVRSGSLSGPPSEPPSSGETTGGARFADRARQRSETPDGLSQPTAQMVHHARGASRHVRAPRGKTVTGRAPIEIGER